MPKNKKPQLSFLQAGFVLDLQTAKIVREWLNEKIQTIEKEINKTSKK